MMTAKEKVLAGVAAIVVGYLVLGDYVLPYRLQPTTLLSASGTNAPSNGATFPQDTRAQATAFCIELITNRYNRVDVYQMLSSGQMTELVDVHQTWQSMGGVSQTPACARQLRSRLTDGLYTLLGNLGEALLGPMGRASAMEQALGSCANDAIQSCMAPVINWEQRVEAIRAAPRQAFQACRQKQGQVVGLTESKARLESELDVARATYEKAEADYAALPDRIPLSQARCP